MATLEWYVIPVKITAAGYKKVDHKLPAHIHIVTGIYCTITKLRKTFPARYVLAFASLGFNEGMTQPIYQAIQPPRLRRKGERHNALPLFEELHTNSILQGYIRDETKNLGFPLYPYTVNIYLSYQRHE